MANFVLIAALLTVFAALFAVWPLWRQSRPLALMIALGLPLVAGGLYWLEGQPEALDPQLVAAPTTMQEAVVQLEKRLATEPDSFEGQALLARSYMALGRFADAQNAYAHALALKPGETDLSVEYAEAMLRASPDRRFPPAAVAMLERAVATHPQNQRGLFFLGLQRMQAEKFAEASALWEKLLPMLDPPAARELLAQINHARDQAGLPALAAAEPVAGPSAAEAGLALELRLDPVIAKSVPANAVLFVFARALDGRGPPFAAKRIEGAQFPLSLRLSDADSPMPAAKLSSQTRVQVMARLSLSGDARPGSGDIESKPAEVETAAGQTTVLLLDQRLP